MNRRRFVQMAAAASTLCSPAVAATSRAATLRFAPQAGLSALDPIWTSAAVVQNASYYTFDTLFALDAALKPQPQMASGYEVSSDGLLWTIRLRDGLVFHDGSPVRSIDCIVSLKRWAARDTMGQLLAARLQEWRATDDRTFTMRLERPFPLMLEALARPIAQAAFIMPDRLAMTDPSKQISEVIGSGPYRFIPGDFVSGAEATFEKFRSYTPAAGSPSALAGGKIANFDRIEWRYIPDPATAAAALRAGEIDWWEQVQPDLVPSLARARGVTVGLGHPSGYVGVIRFNHLQKPFNNPKLRQAVLQAVEQAGYMQAIAGDDPRAWRECHSFFPCGTRYGQGSSPDPMGQRSTKDDLRAMVKASGYEGEKAVVINPSDFPTIAPLGQLTAALLKDIGVNTELAETDWGTVLQRRVNREAVEKGGWSIFHTWFPAISLSNPAASTILRGQGASGWFGWYSDATTEAQVGQWLNAETAQEQDRLAAVIQDRAFANVPAVPLGQFSIRTAYRSDLTGMVEAPVPVPWGVRRS